LAGAEVQGQVGEQRARAEALGQPLHTQQDTHADGTNRVEGEGSNTMFVPPSTFHKGMGPWAQGYSVFVGPPWYLEGRSGKEEPGTRLLVNGGGEAGRSLLWWRNLTIRR